MILESFSFSPCELSRSQCHLLHANHQLDLLLFLICLDSAIFPKKSKKIHGDGHQIICALLPFLDTRYVQPQFYFYNYVIPPSKCFLSAKKSWTASWPYEQNFVDFLIHVNVGVFFIILAWFIQRLTQLGTFCVSFSSLIFSKYLCMMPLSWMC